MAIFGKKPWVNHFGKMSIFRHFELLVFIAQKGIFFVLEYRKNHFPNQYCRKKNVGKKAILGPKPWVNHFGKMSIFRLFELQVFIAQNGDFSIQNIEKVICLTYSAKKKMLEKWPYLDQNHKLTPLEKLQFFDILNYLFLQPRKAFFRLFELQVFIAQKGEFSLQNIEKVICLTYSAKKKNVGKMAIFGPKQWVNLF